MKIFNKSLFFVIIIVSFYIFIVSSCICFFNPGGFISFTAPGFKKENFLKIKLGMTEEEVSNLIGKPISVRVPALISKNRTKKKPLVSMLGIIIESHRLFGDVQLM